MPAIFAYWERGTIMGADPIVSGSLNLLGFGGGRWEISLARKLRDKCGARCAWLAVRMRYSSASFLRKLLSED
jgi:hypothetical protein